MGIDASVISNKNGRNPVTQEQKRRPENTKNMGKGEGKALDTNGLCA